jgi:selenocysteine lyase/cysteine desulfurase
VWIEVPYFSTVLEKNTELKLGVNQIKRVSHTQLAAVDENTRMYSSFSPNSILKIGFGQSLQYLATLYVDHSKNVFSACASFLISKIVSIYENGI